MSSPLPPYDCWVLSSALPLTLSTLASPPPYLPLPQALSGRESDPARLEVRARQLENGRNTAGYLRYRLLRAKEDRVTGDPVTPDIHRQVSKNAFLASLSDWRRALHAYDLHRDPGAERRQVREGLIQRRIGGEGVAPREEEAAPGAAGTLHRRADGRIEAQDWPPCSWEVLGWIYSRARLPEGHSLRLRGSTDDGAEGGGWGAQEAWEGALGAEEEEGLEEEQEEEEEDDWAAGRLSSAAVGAERALGAAERETAWQPAGSKRARPAEERAPERRAERALAPAPAAAPAPAPVRPLRELSSRAAHARRASAGEPLGDSQRRWPSYMPRCALCEAAHEGGGDPWAAHHAALHEGGGAAGGGSHGAGDARWSHAAPAAAPARALAWARAAVAAQQDARRAAAAALAAARAWRAAEAVNDDDTIGVLRERLRAALPGEARALADDPLLV